MRSETAMAANWSTCTPRPINLITLWGVKLPPAHSPGRRVQVTLIWLPCEEWNTPFSRGSFTSVCYINLIPLWGVKPVGQERVGRGPINPITLWGVKPHTANMGRRLMEVTLIWFPYEEWNFGWNAIPSMELCYINPIVLTRSETYNRWRFSKSGRCYINPITLLRSETTQTMDG